MPHLYPHDYSRNTPFCLEDLVLPFLVLLLVVLGGGTSLGVQSAIFLGLGTCLLLKKSYTVPFRGLDYLVIGIVILSWVQFLPRTGLGEMAWATKLYEEYNLRLSPTISVQPGVSLEAYFCFLSALAWFYICMGQDIHYSMRVCSLWALSLGGAVLGGVVLLGNYFSWSYPFAKEATVFSFFPNRNQTSHVLCLSAFISFCLFIKGLHKKQNRFALLALSASIIAFFALIYALSRASLIFFFLGLSIWLCLQERRHKGFLQFRYLLPILGIFISLWLISSGENLDRFLRVLSLDAEVDFRVLIFKDALACIREQVWTGIGLGNFQYVFPQFREHSVLYGRVLHPENDWLWVCSELGLGFTLVLFAGVFYGLFQSLKHQPSDRISYRSIAFIAVLIFLLHTFTDVPGHRLGTAFYAIFLFALASSHHERVESLVPIYLFRCVGLILICAGLLGLGSTALKWPLWHTARVAHSKRAILNAAQSKNADQALATIQKAKQSLPLHPLWYFQEGQVQLRLNTNYILAKKAFEAARALDPHAIHLPLQEGLLWLPYNLDLAFRAWQIALNVDNYSTESTWHFILSHTAGPRFQKHLSVLARSHLGFRVFYLKQLEPHVLEKEIQYDLLKNPRLSHIDEKDRLKILLIWAGGTNPHAVLGLLAQEPHMLKEPWQVVSKAYARLGFYEAAATLLDKHIEAPQWPILYATQSSKLEELEFRSAFNSKDTILHLALLKAYVEKQTYTKALATIKRLEHLEYPSLLLNYWKGKLYYHQGRYQESVEAYQRFLN